MRPHCVAEFKMKSSRQPYNWEKKLSALTNAPQPVAVLPLKPNRATFSTRWVAASGLQRGAVDSARLQLSAWSCVCRRLSHRSPPTNPVWLQSDRRRSCSSVEDQHCHRIWSESKQPEGNNLFSHCLKEETGSVKFARELTWRH